MDGELIRIINYDTQLRSRRMPGDRRGRGHWSRASFTIALRRLTSRVRTWARP